jgi:hypothetical protein
MSFKEGMLVRAVTNYGQHITNGLYYRVVDSDRMFTSVLDNYSEKFYAETTAFVEIGRPASSPTITTLPTDSTERKNYPLFRGLLRYFPAALAGVAKISKLGNDKHNPGEEMHHARAKSADQGDCIVRHLIDVEDLLAARERGDSSVTSDAILMEVNQMAWRALAFSQELHEKLGAPLAPGAKK